jgi:hypothetical protein
LSGVNDRYVLDANCIFTIFSQRGVGSIYTPFLSALDDGKLIIPVDSIDTVYCTEPTAKKHLKGLDNFSDSIFTPPPVVVRNANAIRDYPEGDRIGDEKLLSIAITLSEDATLVYDQGTPRSKRMKAVAKAAGASVVGLSKFLNTFT